MSKIIVTQTEFLKLADERLEEARLLLRARKWSGAYYLAGYAIELALKACIIKSLMMTDAFPDKEFSRNCYTHSLDKLVGATKLGDVRKLAESADPALLANWSVVNSWSEEKRYHEIDEAEAEVFFTAVSDAAHGVLSWIKKQL